MSTSPRIALALAVLPLLVACASSGPPVSIDAPLEGTRWHVVEVRGEQPPEGVEPFLVIESADGQAMGRAGCNNFNGPYRATGNELVMGPLASTRMRCETYAAYFEELMLEALGATRFYVIRGNDLFLYDGPDAHVRLRVGMEG